MTALSTRSRRRTAALIGGAALLTATATGAATADTAPEVDPRTTIVCTAPDGPDRPLPPLPTEPGGDFRHVVPGPGEGRSGGPGTPLDGVECVRINPDGSRVVVPAPTGYAHAVPVHAMPTHAVPAEAVPTHVVPAEAVPADAVPDIDLDQFPPADVLTSADRAEH